MIIVATRAMKISTNTIMKNDPNTGTCEEVSGTELATNSRYTAMASSIVIQNPILSPLSDGIKKLI